MVQDVDTKLWISTIPMKWEYNTVRKLFCAGPSKDVINSRTLPKWTSMDLLLHLSVSLAIILCLINPSSRPLREDQHGKPGMFEH